ncbi:reverse transcriptase family protein [Maribellus sediminis]|uniref:reverse transcriptase family protein n=1 Tax=Maribellus sediminis TaxID=2696285 RepID=UPI001431071D|nr:reverse transcriptase family protein [Maribellus sediminis]
MRKRIKDLAYALKVPSSALLEMEAKLVEDEAKFYNNWDEPKTDEFGQPKYKDGVLQTRPINAPVKQLKQIQSGLLHNVLYKIKLPDYFYGGIAGKDAVKNARFHQGNKYFFQTDLKDFYPSIGYTKVEHALRKQGFYPDVARLITRLSTKEGAIPQGCPTSSYLASMVLFDLVGNLFEKYISEGFKLSIYVDDLTISSPTDFKDRTAVILAELRDRGLLINFDKTSYSSKNPSVTGVVVKNNGIAAPAHTYENSINATLSENSRKGHQMRIAYIKKISKQK